MQREIAKLQQKMWLYIVVLSTLEMYITLDKCIT